MAQRKLIKITPETFKSFPQETHPERLFVLDHLPSVESKKIILDVGCGTNKTREDVVGVDPRAVADVVADAENLPFSNNFADVIVMRHSLEHVLNQVAVVREWRRVLKCDGTVIIVLPDHSLVDTMDPILSCNQHLHAYSPLSFYDFISQFAGWFKFKQIPQPVVYEWSFGAVIQRI